jgi:transposase
MLAAISSEGDMFFQFLKGNCNEASVCAFIFKLAQALDEQRPEWRNRYVLLMDNSATHKTQTVTRLIDLLKIPTLFSAPASYLVAPIERVFGALKQKDFESEEAPPSLKAALPRAQVFTRTQILISMISDSMFGFKKEHLVHFYTEGFRHLALFLDRQLV